MGLMNRALTVQEFSAGVGVVEVAIALLIALRPWSRKGSAIGSPALVQLFLKTLSFLFRRLVGRSFPRGFPALTARSGQFLPNNVVLLGAAIWSPGEAPTPKEKPTIKP